MPIKKGLWYLQCLPITGKTPESKHIRPEKYRWWTEAKEQEQGDKNKNNTNSVNNIDGSRSNNNNNNNNNDKEINERKEKLTRKIEEEQ